ncbi:hypothetical protein B0H66DRAFT_535048 [Apodospora peruviana]|uniref:Uncharacterized protein n=1 Tax=Apodospora peruviana TaxID=516989 RepID=A0AAE0I1J7_9PEZI|nr:hypothetical protein B0H66DRAFT_535048 [Apodospora peruviana]
MKSLIFTAVTLLATLGIASPSPGVVNATHDNIQVTRADPWYIGTECKNSKAGNIYGTCQYTSTCKSRTGTVDSNPDCPGPDNVQCCVYDNCLNGAKGTCVDTRNFKCQGNGGYNQWVILVRYHTRS